VQNQLDHYTLIGGFPEVQTIDDEIRRQGLAPEYYVTQSGVEVDFVIPGKDKSERQLIQVCWEMSDPATQKREVNALLSAMNELGISRSTIVTWLDEDYSDRRIDIVPSWKWLLA
jgi:hypothetical protein